MEKYNIYCDESCHLEHDNSDVMVLGAIMCSAKDKYKLFQAIAQKKEKFGLNKNFEIKWTKVSPGLFDFYKELIDLFFENNIYFRCIIINNKKALDNEKYCQSYDDWYYKMYYLLLRRLLEPTNQYSVYIDIKGTNGGKKAKKLKTILNNALYSFSETCLEKLQIVQSHEVPLMQLCDLIMGCICFYNRFVSVNNCGHTPSQAKIGLCDHLFQKHGNSLSKTTLASEEKLNIFVWEPQK